MAKIVFSLQLSENGQELRRIRQAIYTIRD